jgi:hypothetical protein
MSLPGDRLPEEIQGSHSDGQPPAASADKSSVYDRNGTEWAWVPAKGQYVNTEPTYRGPGAVTPGAIPEEFQPFYAYPPNAAQRAAAEIYTEER